MNYLYKESTISNPVESVLILGDYFLFHHHSTLTVLDQSLNVVRKRYFYEKILGIRKTADLTIIILFHGNKLVQCDIDFNPTALRIVDGTNFDVHNSICIVYNKYTLQYFNAKEEEIKAMKFSNFNLHNITGALMMPNYVSTVFVHSQSKGNSVACIISLDGTPSKIDEFDTLEDPIHFKITEKFMIIANRNFLQIKYRRESFVVCLNQNLPSSILKDGLKCNVITPIYDDSKESRNIFLENPFIFLRGDSVFIINGNGELFGFHLKLEVKKILSISISFLGTISKPSCIDYDENALCVGSIYDDTILYAFSNTYNIDENKYKVNENMPEVSAAEACEFDTHSYDMNVYKQDNINVAISEKARVRNIGLVTSFSKSNGRDLILASNNGIYRASFSAEVLIYKKHKIDMKISRITTFDNSPIILTQDKAFSVNDELKLTEVLYDEKFNSYYEDGYAVILDKSGLLSVFLNEKLIKSFSGVTTWCFHQGALALLKNEAFEFIDISTLKVLFSSRRIAEFDNEIFNDEIIARSNIQEILSQNQELLGNMLSNRTISEKIAEIRIFKNIFSYFIFRTTKQLYIYKYNDQRLTKILISKAIGFGNERQALFDLGKYIYCRSKHPCIIVFDKEVYVYDTAIRLGCPIALNGWIFATSKGYLLKCKFADVENLIFTDSLILKRLHSFENKITNANSGGAKLNSSVDLEHQSPQAINKKQHSIGEVALLDDSNTSKKEEGKDLLEDYREKFSIRHMISLEDCNILTIARQVPFFYYPFIPMVHISDKPGGKLHSEPINKEEAEYVNKNPCLRGRTLRYSIELRSIDFKLISSTTMEENEFICDMKIMFNSFLVVCTSFPEGEDKMTKGRLIVYSLVNIVPDPDNPHITKKLKLICSEALKNPCLCCEEIRSLISVCIGTKLMIYEFNENTGLAAVGRHELSLLCTSLFVTKNLIAVSDIMNGVYFFFLRPNDPLKLHLLSRSCPIPSCRFLGGVDFCSVHEADTLQLSIVSICKYGTIRIFTYSPYDPVSKNGNQLVKRAEIVTNLRAPLYKASFGQINNFELMLLSSNVMIRLCAINVPKIQAIQHCISIFISDRCGINARNYLETEEFVNPECKSIICERTLLEFFYFKPAVQEKICELVGLDYFSVAGLIESCLYTFMSKKVI